MTHLLTPSLVPSPQLGLQGTWLVKMSLPECDECHDCHECHEDVITKEVAEVQIPPGYSAQTEAGAQSLLLSLRCLIILSLGSLWTELEASL